MKKHQGFTLIELIIIIIVLGILAAYAISKYMNIDTEARKSSVISLNGTIKSATNLVHMIALLKNQKSAGNVNIGSSNVEVGNGLYPTASDNGIVESLSNVSGFNINHDGLGKTSFKKTGSRDDNTCLIVYDISNENVPDFVVDTNGC